MCWRQHRLKMRECLDCWNILCLASVLLCPSKVIILGAAPYLGCFLLFCFVFSCTDILNKDEEFLILGCSLRPPWWCGSCWDSTTGPSGVWTKSYLWVIFSSSTPLQLHIAMVNCVKHNFLLDLQLTHYQVNNKAHLDEWSDMLPSKSVTLSHSTCSPKINKCSCIFSLFFNDKSM